MPRDKMHKGYYIRVYESIISDDKFFSFVDVGLTEDYSSVSRLIGNYLLCMFILARHPEKKGWAYQNGSPLLDRMSARAVGLPLPYWEKSLEELIKVKLIQRDKNGAWGVGEEKWKYYQGAPEHDREYIKNYMAARRKETSNPVDETPPTGILPRA